MRFAVDICDTLLHQGSFPSGTPGNGVHKVILTVGTALKPPIGELYKKAPCLHQNLPIWESK